MQTFIERPRELPVMTSCDVMVAGGGIAGIAAALAAARTSKSLDGAARKRVLLTERECLLGGLATLGLVTVYLPLCDGMGRQVSFGLAEELLRLSIKHGAEARYPDAWLENKSREEKAAQRFMVQFNPHFFALEAERLLLREGVEILYHAQICGVEVKGGRITHVVIENKAGRSAVAVNTVVDATGDADICKLAGEKTVDFEQQNVLASWYYYINEGPPELAMLGAADITGGEKKQGAPRPLVNRRFTGLDDISDMLCLSHEKMLEHILARKAENAAYTPITLPTIPQVRMTRRIAGIRTLDECDRHRSFSDSIGIISNWRKSGPIYEIPASTLYGETIKNLIAAGRCISATDAMWDISRVIPPCAVTGEAAGTAASMSDDFIRMDIAALQNELMRKKVVTKISDL